MTAVTSDAFVLENSWLRLLKDELCQPWCYRLQARLVAEYQAHPHDTYPPARQVFRAMNECPVPSVRVVIIGQDPYPSPGMAEGLSFSVASGIKQLPPSLQNIKAEIARDLGTPTIIEDGHLGPWVAQGVLLLNRILTVRRGQSGIHRALGWQWLTNAIIQRLSAESPHPIVFLLWGNDAREVASLIARPSYHLVLQAGHPSPLNRKHDFEGCRHFSQANDFLRQHGLAPIRW